MPKNIDFLSNIAPKMVSKMVPLAPIWGGKLPLGTTSGRIRLQVLFQNSPLLFQNSFLMIFHDFWSLGALFFTMFGPCLVWFSDMFFILFFLLLIYVFIEVFPHMPNPKTEGGGGVSPPGVFDIIYIYIPGSNIILYYSLWSNNDNNNNYYYYYYYD